jgi:hypothetical protein
MGNGHGQRLRSCFAVLAVAGIGHLATATIGNDIFPLIKVCFIVRCRRPSNRQPCSHDCSLKAYSKTSIQDLI